MITKSHILAEIRRTTSTRGGQTLGHAGFERETGIKKSDWYGKYWRNWGEALIEAGFQPNKFQGAYAERQLVEHLAVLIRELGRFPVEADLRMKARAAKGFPSHTAFAKLGDKRSRAQKVLTYCAARPEFEDVREICDRTAGGRSTEHPATEATAEPAPPFGHVYLVQHGTRREYRSGCTYNLMRREGEVAIELPEGARPVHTIQTDDPYGVEAYWHRRFERRRKNGDWFALSSAEVRAFKRWRRIY